MKKSAANSKKSNDVKFYALCKYKNGESVSAIAREIGVSKSTVHYWIKTIQVPEGAKAEDYVEITPLGDHLRRNFVTPSSTQS
ncbi:MAG: helix-turn-helix domain-containing protein [Succinimonas sp.]|nr:helix-turn-helix domain-containing protein [Succinimonas sp.]